ncbi:MAG: hypothetical protein HKN40_10160 [Winogradskyella sp.]|uniref:hypothetical protein n=1 Tax=Winogradskyella sp. TaxID=1883156 RepID=UPI0017F76965|nr:hypothetical protein [Winogradskyella sp.]
MTISSLLNKIIKVDTSSRKWYSIILWWELRRIPYNLILIGLTAFLLLVISLIPNEGFVVVFTGPVLIVGTYLSILLYFIGANILFSLGWVLQIILRNFNETRIQFLIRNLFIIGIIISVLVTLSPIVILLINLLLGKAV